MLVKIGMCVTDGMIDVWEASVPSMFRNQTVVLGRTIPSGTKLALSSVDRIGVMRDSLQVNSQLQMNKKLRG